MPLIKPRTRGKQLVRHIARLDRETNETLFAYAEFIGEPTDYVLNQAIDTILGKNKDFQAWRAEHRESFVPRPGNNSHKARRGTERQPPHQHVTADLAAAGSVRDKKWTLPCSNECSNNGRFSRCWLRRVVSSSASTPIRSIAVTCICS